MHVAHHSAHKGVSASQLAVRLQVDVLQLEPVLETLLALDWAGQLDEAKDNTEARYLLMADPDSTRLEPLLERLLLDKSTSLSRFWSNGAWPQLRLRDAL